MDDNLKGLLALLAGAAICVMMGLGIGMAMARMSITEEAINAGCTEWQCDPATGKTELKWLPPEDGSDE